ncbi:hypothetical protein AQ505_13350 [Pedobacter sp. PACM 27299]|nr:hypothetical protein AQ505_13350 [Pedobacter sp. PACM 27299]
MAFTQPVCAQEDPQKTLIQGLDSMFAGASEGPLLKSLAADFSVGAYSHQTAVNCLKTIASRYSCDSIRLKGVQEIGGSSSFAYSSIQKEKRRWRPPRMPIRSLNYCIWIFLISCMG